MGIKKNRKIAISLLISTKMETLATAMDQEAPHIHVQGDTEHLHRFRIALRKMRTLVSLGKDVIAKDDYCLLKDGYAWLSQATGDARDADVQLASLVSLTEQHELLGLVVEELKKDRSEHYHLLASALVSSNYSSLQEDTRRTIAKLSTQEVEACIAIDEFQKGYFTKLQKQLLNQCSQLDQDGSADVRHTLRKTNKKLRASLVFFADTLDPVSSQKVQKAAKSLHELLGHLQDLYVQEQWFLSRMNSNRALGEGRAFLLGRLSGIVFEKQNQSIDCLADELLAYQATLTRYMPKLVLETKK